MRALGLAMAALLVGNAPARADTMLVFAAASTSDALTEIAHDFTRATGHEVRFSFAGSSTLARQIDAGAPVDVFVSADRAWMDAVEKAGLVRARDRRDLLTNTLVVVVPADSSTRIAGARDLAALKRIALADPAAVPAGKYARAWLTRAGAWDAVAAHVVPTLDVRAALAAAAAGAVDAAVVYATDAATTSKVRVAYAVPPSDTPPIVYPVARLAHAPHPAAADAFVAWLTSATARATFARHGFGVAR